jgi:IS30 family transposase
MVCREIRYNGWGVAYWAGRAARLTCKLGQQPRLRRLIAEDLEVRWFPQQITGWLPCSCPAGPALQVSFETIFQTLFVQARGALKWQL